MQAVGLPVHVQREESAGMPVLSGKGAEMNGKDTSLFSKASDEWGTPQWLFDLLDREFHFQVDAAATKENAKLPACFEDLDSVPTLEFDWYCKGAWERFFLNPPYSAGNIDAFMKKAYEESQKGALVVCLVPCATDTRWWHNYAMKAQEIRFIKGRLKFGDSKTGAPFPSVIVIFRKETPMQFLSHPYGPVIGPTIEQPKNIKIEPGYRCNPDHGCPRKPKPEHPCPSVCGICVSLQKVPA